MSEYNKELIIDALKGKSTDIIEIFDNDSRINIRQDMVSIIEDICKNKVHNEIVDIKICERLSYLLNIINNVKMISKYKTFINCAVKSGNYKIMEILLNNETIRENMPKNWHTYYTVIMKSYKHIYTNILQTPVKVE